ncbi:UrvD/REP family ATP-dependent DNA helicase [Demequina sp. NBRC 110051]|uniref:UrvD/REP family ATP-dependent DNA helicase n=1 Tax=Demequina sp. NBRC 110051 TaxID=1570340 RepID=UPI000A077489|nr:UrvD/REP family ATP-dependent DNA helicase [Demequina sp. NBRC 110051]
MTFRGAPSLSDEQRAAIAAADAGHAVVVGPPGSGKTTVVAAAAARAVAQGMAPERLLVLAPTRTAAADLRDVVSATVDRATGVPVVRTAASVAHTVLAARAEALGDPAPTLITGADQDAILRDLLAGHARGEGAAPDWSGVVPAEATALPGFRAELRDLLMRATEAGLDPEAMRELGERTGRREWVAGAEVLAEYLDNVMWRSLLEDQGLRYDPAGVAREAAVALDDWDGAWGVAPSWDLVIVDDYQDATAAVIALLEALAERGSRLLLVGNADESVQGYRGAVPSALAQATAPSGRHALGASLVRLTQQHRQGAALAAVVGALTQRIGTVGAGSARGAVAESGDGAPDAVEILVAPHRYAQSRAIAAALRRAHHGVDGGGTPWGRMAVIARSNGQLRALHADLLGAEIPCESLGDGVALHEQPVVAPLLTMMLIAVGEREWTEEDATQVLASRLVGLDPVELRRLRRALVREDRGGGGHAAAGELLAQAMEDPARLASLGGEEARAARKASAAVASAAHAARDGQDTPRRLLWVLWESLEVAEPWRKAALAGSARDDADLDAVIALLREAQNVEERMRGATAAGFAAHLTSQEFAIDSLGARATGGDTVTFATPASAAGREWDVVVVAGVEEGVWPNVRLRDSVLGAQHLADILAFRADPEPLDADRRSALAASSRKAVLDDETRALVVALSRARRSVVVTAVEDDDTRPSRYVDWLEAAASVTRRDTGTVPRVSDLRHAVAALRAEGAAASGEDRAGYATALARLAEARVAGADPRAWNGVASPSTEAGFFAEDAPVRVSPSRVEGVERCALRWALESSGGVGLDSDKQQLGTLVHEIAQLHPDGDRATLQAALDERWHEIAGDDTLPNRVLRAKAEAMIDRLAGYFVSHPVDAVELEQRFEVGIDRAVLTGSADRVEHRGDATRIVDLKTGNPDYAGDPSTHAQLAMYQLAAAHGAFPGVERAAGADLVFVGGSNRSASVKPQGAIDVDEQRARLGAVVETMTSARFLATENDMCGQCPVRRSCPVQVEGRQVSEA